MSEIYPRWVAAHGVMIITPVYWYQAPSVRKSMIDRLVCADGGDPDPSSTHGKKAEEAKQVELKGWNYSRHLAGRRLLNRGTAIPQAQKIYVDSWPAGSTTCNLQAGTDSCLDRCNDHYGPYATSHGALDKNEALRQEVRNAVQALINQVAMPRASQKAAG